MMKSTPGSIIFYFYSLVTELLVSRLIDSKMMKSKLAKKMVCVCLGVRVFVHRHMCVREKRDGGGRERRGNSSFFDTYFCAFRMQLHLIC